MTTTPAAATAMAQLGAYLRASREARGLTVDDVSRATKIKARALTALEEGAVDDLPATVFVRGFVSAYARLVGIDAEVAVAKVREALPDPDFAEAAATAQAEPDSRFEVRTLFVRPSRDSHERPQAAGGRRLGVVMVVFLVLVVATLTLSLILGQGKRDRLGAVEKPAPSLLSG